MMGFRPIAWAAFGLAAALAAPPALAQITWNDVLNFRAPAENPFYGRTRLAKGAADECYAGIGVDYPPLNPDGSCSLGVPKHNLAYVWGLTQAGLGVSGFAGDALWWGTFANPLCSGASGDLVEPDPEDTGSWVCEFGQSMLARRPVAPLPPSAGDWRLPRVYSYNRNTGQVTDRTPADTAFQVISGLRSAGSLGNAVFVAGPTFTNDVTFAAFDAATGAYRGACRATALAQIRNWITVNGVLYAGAGRDTGDGVLLRWRGTLDNPFPGAGKVSELCGFEVVGVLPSLPSYLANYDGQRIAATTWNRTSIGGPGPGGSSFTAGLYLGPLFDAQGGYTAANAGARWTRLWSPASYERDPVVLSTIGVNAVAFWRGWLYYGTMHNNASASSTHQRCPQPQCYGPTANADELVDLTFQTSRATSIWRARLGADGNPEVQMLYGQTELPALVPGTKTWEMKPTGWTPRFGPAGFGNPFVTYAWSVSAGADDLLFGMYDYRFVFDVRLGVMTPARKQDARRGYGADVWRFANPELPATPETVNGLGNFTNYGVRNILRLDGGPSVIMGTASGLNLEPLSGWEVHRLTPPATAQGGQRLSARP